MEEALDVWTQKGKSGKSGENSAKSGGKFGAGLHRPCF